VDAPLDDANIDKVATRSLSNSVAESQFIIVSPTTSAPWPAQILFMSITLIGLESAGLVPVGFEGVWFGYFPSAKRRREFNGIRLNWMPMDWNGV